jgi:hypothetical protein
VSTSQIFPALDALVAITIAAVPATITVYDGPVTITPPEQDFIIVGAEDVYNQGQPIAAVDGTSDWAALGAGKRDEFFTIHNTYVAWSGDETLTTTRARAQTNIGLIETALRTTGKTLNGTLNSPGWCALQITKVAQVKPGNGCQVHVTYGVVCRGRI